MPVLLDGANLEHGRLGDAVDKAILDVAAQLDIIALGRARKDVARLLMPGSGNLGSLDDKLSEIIRERVGKSDDGSKAKGEVEPWPMPITDLGAVLDDAVGRMKRHVAAPDTHFYTAVLWGVHAHLLHREELEIDVTSRLGFQSPEPNSGKSTFMKLVRELVPRPRVRVR